MRWSVAIPGQPLSWDAAYRTGLMPVTRKIGGRRVAVLREDGKQKMIHRPILTEEARAFRDDVQKVVQAACPSNWHPTGQIRVFVGLFLTNDMDCDNATKLVFDGVARAIGIDDMMFIPCYRPKVTGVRPQGAGVVLTFDDEVGAHA